MMTITKCVRDDNCSKINVECNKTKQHHLCNLGACSLQVMEFNCLPTGQVAYFNGMVVGGPQHRIYKRQFLLDNCYSARAALGIASWG